MKFAVFSRIVLGLVLAGFSFQSISSSSNEGVKFRRIPTQFIAALGDPNAKSGNGAEFWGIWKLDPGPRGVWLADYAKLKQAGGVAPSNWQFQDSDWWLEENGILMEAPEFPVDPGKYVVTGDRETVTILTIHPEDADGNQQWELDGDATLYDVTHLPCRSARYTPMADGEGCTPASANRSQFPVTPGSLMPGVQGCQKQDYAVLFVIGVEVKN